MQETFLVRGRLSMIGCLLFAGGVGLSQMAADNYVVYGVRPETSPEIVLDGVLDEPVWQRAGSMGAFHFIEQIDALTPTRQTVVRGVYTAEALYLAIECLETDLQAIHADFTDNQVHGYWSDDCVEIYIDPSRTYERFCKVAVNPRGVVWALVSNGAFEDRTWVSRCGVEAGAAIMEDRWVAEVRIPFSGVGRPAKGDDLWAFNVRRIRWGDPRRLEDSSWSAGAVSNNPWRFGHLYFQERPGAFQMEALSPIWTLSAGAVIELVMDSGRMFLHNNAGLVDGRIAAVAERLAACRAEHASYRHAGSSEDPLLAKLRELEATLETIRKKRGTGDVAPAVMAEIQAPLDRLARQAADLRWSVIWKKTIESEGK